MKRKTAAAMVGLLVSVMTLAGCDALGNYTAPTEIRQVDPATGQIVVVPGPSRAQDELGPLTPILTLFGPAGAAASVLLTGGLAFAARKAWVKSEALSYVRSGLKIVTEAIDAADAEAAGQVKAKVQEKGRSHHAGMMAVDQVRGKRSDVRVLKRAGL